jgi:nitroimidazol reductase NimA-like FMN-containing flavoprotein (pyridoxamine 5'-phosphate oxidase superfamily)
MPSRRGSISFSDTEIRAYLDSRKTLIIVSNGRDGYPHPMPMWFCVDDTGALYCTTFRKSQKVLNFRRDPKASLLVESGTEYAELKGVVIYADTEVIDDLAVATDTLVKINTRGRSLDEAARQALTGTVRKTAEKRIVLKFTPRDYVSWDHSRLGGRY